MQLTLRDRHMLQWINGHGFVTVEQPRVNWLTKKGAEASEPKQINRMTYFHEKALIDIALSVVARTGGVFWPERRLKVEKTDMHDIKQQRITEAFHDRLGGFTRDALADPDAIEVMVNACGRVWLDSHHRHPGHRHDERSTSHPLADHAKLAGRPLCQDLRARWRPV